jgi:phosphoribosylformylglycinamidine cyclo-ligase
VSGATYRGAGVDIDAKAEMLARVRARVRSTFTPAVLGDIGHFAGLVRVPGMREPVLVSSIDGVGTKTKVASLLGRHAVIGHDAVAHALNDVAVQGATPLLFLDYVGASRLDADVFEQLVAGMTDACRAYGVALIGGETAEMPGVYAEGEYDAVGCAVGVVERERIVDGTGVQPDDIVVGLASDGLHTNGYTLARAVLLRDPSDAARFEPTLGETRGDALLRPHRCYAPLLLDAIERLNGDRNRPQLVGAAHITGGGIGGNLVRVLPAGCRAEIDTASWEWPALFGLLQRTGGIAQDEIFRAFNMGVGMCAVLRPSAVGAFLEIAAAHGDRATPIGRIVNGERGVALRAAKS